MLVHAQSVGFDFVLDDGAEVVNNTYVQDLAPLMTPLAAFGPKDGAEGGEAEKGGHAGRRQE